MTNVVKKGAGRAAHAERTAKHAQRTPLPPKGGKPMKPTTADIIKDESAKAAKAAATPKPRAARTKPAKAATANAEPKSKPSPKKATRKAPAAVPAPELAPKVAALVEHAAAQGWTTEVESAKPLTIVTAERDGERLITTFIDNRMDASTMPVYVRRDGSRVLMRNVSAVKKQMNADPEARPVRSVITRSPRTAGSTEEPQRRVPFDIEKASDDDVASALRGATISWRNGGTEPESAEVGTRRAPEVREHPKHLGVGAKRVISFFTVERDDKGVPVCGPERHVSLDRLLTVSR